MKKLKFIFVVGLCFCLLTGCNADIVQQNGAAERATEAVDTEAYAKEVLRLENEYRVSLGLNELTWDDDLAYVANIRAQEIVVCWSHTRPDGSMYVDILDDMNYPSPLVGENLGKHQKTPSSVMEQWKESPSHNKNLVGDFNKLGVSCYEFDGKLYWVQIFAK